MPPRTRACTSCFGFILLAALAFCAARPPKARAYDVCDGACELIGLAVVSVALVPPLAFVGAQIYFGAQERWFPTGWAIVELFYGITLDALSLAAATSPNIEAGAVAPFIAVYSWLALHAVLSLAIGDRGPPGRAKSGPQVAIAPLEDGAWLGVRGGF